MKAIILTVVKSGNFRVSSGTGLLFGQTRAFLFLPNQQLLNLQSCFSFPEANCWASLASFSKLAFGGPLEHDRGLAANATFKGSIPCGNIGRVILLS